MRIITLQELLRQLTALDSPLDPALEVVLYDPNEDVNLGSPTAAVMFRDQSGNLWQSVQDAQANADLQNVDPEATEIAVTGELTKVVAIRIC